MKYQMEYVTEELLKEIRDLDRDIYSSRVSMDWYLNNYRKLERIATARDENNLIGYFVITGIKSSLFEAIKDGTLSGDVSFTSNAFLNEKETSKYYGSSIVVKEGFRKSNVALRLSKLGFNYIKECNPNGGYQIVAIALSEKVARVCKAFGAEITGKIDDAYIVLYKSN